MNRFILLFFLQMLSVNEAYNFTCPSQTHWNIRAKSICKPPRHYVCLFNITFRVNVYRERCNRPRILDLGYKYVFQPNLNRAPCSVNRYQPFIFNTNGYSDCAFQKSLCNNIGQETYENRNSRFDRKCTCIIDEGYTFVRNSQNKSYCSPSTEDCSCYRGINPSNKTIGMKDIKSYDDMEVTQNSYLEDMLNISQRKKRPEFDNYKYNLNHLPTSEYRLEAVKWLFIWAFIYGVVLVIVLVIRRLIQVHSTPRKFSIVECTDCLIIIEWFMDVPDICLSYELHYRPHGKIDWSTKTFLSKDVLQVEEVGRRMFKLQNMQHETYYELKMRSIYSDDIKSHYSESQTKQTLKLAPKNFSIVECSDCSITIEWSINDQDDCLEYELNYRIQETDRWTVETLSNKDWIAEENGRLMYKLSNVLPETAYELKLCSIGGHVNSHYTEFKTKQTLKRVLPEAINQLSEGDKFRYNTLMQSSKCEKRYFVRTMIVGKESVGKTCLLRRLLKEDISDVTSTDGVDIVVRRCKINIEDGKWTIGKEIDDDKISRIKRAQIPNPEDRETQNIHVDDTIDIHISQRNEMSTFTKDTTIDQNVFLYSREDTNDKLVVKTDADTKDENKDTNKRLSLSTPENFSTDAKLKLDYYKEKNESQSLVIPEDLMSHVFSKSTDNFISNHYALCELWDFAGQKDFYATHQAFLTSCAVYLVVADMNDDINKKELSQCFADFEKIGEYVEFWFDSIHCHRHSDERANNGHFHPPIILVFTGKDKYDKEADFDKRQKELNYQIDQAFGFKSKYHHLHKKFYLSNLKDTDEEFEKLRYEIYENAKKMNNWGNPFPLKWILLEHLIDINKNNKKNFINFTDMSKLAKHRDINIVKDDELLLFLRFQHNVGNIIFFENIRDLVILNPQWLADAFRCLLSHKVDNRLHHREDWTLFIRQGKISESLITELFESKDGSKFSGQTKNMHAVMEKLDILVKIDKSYCIMPSMMPSENFENVCKQFGILTKKCKRTSWLCFKFDFLPPSFFNHLSAWFIRKYNPSKLDNGIALYRGICMFDIGESGWKKILVTMSTDTIALQVVSFSEQQEGFGNTCSYLHRDVTQLIEDIKERYKVKISYKIHFQCSDGVFHKDAFEYEKLRSDKECYCFQHKRVHRSHQLYSPWMNKKVERIPDRATKMTKQDDNNPKNEPTKDTAFTLEEASAKYKIPISTTLSQRIIINMSKNENQNISSCIKTNYGLVLTDRSNKRLIICQSDGTTPCIDHIPLSYSPCYITGIDSNTVAVSCTNDKTILLINISTRVVNKEIKTDGICDGLSYDGNYLYVIIWTAIIVMDLTGQNIRSIRLPEGEFYDITVERDRMVCLDNASIYCCSLDGQLLWKFENDQFQDLRRVTIDHEWNVYVTDNKKNAVVVITDNGEHYSELLTASDGLDGPYGIYFDKKESVCFVCNRLGDNAFIFDVKHK